MWKNIALLMIASLIIISCGKSNRDLTSTNSTKPSNHISDKQDMKAYSELRPRIDFQIDNKKFEAMAIDELSKHGYYSKQKGEYYFDKPSYITIEETTSGLTRKLAIVLFAAHDDNGNIYVAFDISPNKKAEFLACGKAIYKYSEFIERYQEFYTKD
jgi:hypothetical protein